VTNKTHPKTLNNVSGKFTKKKEKKSETKEKKKKKKSQSLNITTHTCTHKKLGTQKTQSSLPYYK
jgi:hypothetical protein